MTTHRRLDHYKSASPHPQTNKKKKHRSSLCCCLFNENKCLISLWSTLYSILIVVLHVYLIQAAVQKCINLNKRDGFIDLVVYLTKNAVALAQETRAASDDDVGSSHSNVFIYYELVTRLCLIALSATFLVLFLICSLCKVGNYANDAVKFGRDFFAEKTHHTHSRALRASPPKLVNLVTAGKIDDDEESELSNAGSLLVKDEPKRRGCCSRSCCCCCCCCCGGCRRFFAGLFDFVKLVYRHFLPFNSFFHLLSILCLLLPDLFFAYR
jgi:hypothetical protein